jgi:hypothetical protein
LIGFLIDFQASPPITGTKETDAVSAQREPDGANARPSTPKRVTAPLTAGAGNNVHRNAAPSVFTRSPGLDETDSVLSPAHGIPRAIPFELGHHCGLNLTLKPPFCHIAIGI